MPHPWPVPPLPTVLGLEGVGIVEAVGPDVGEVAVGDRVAYASPPHGAYAERRLMVADRLVKLPDGIGDVTAAGMMLKGLTAQYLLRRTYRVQPGDIVKADTGGIYSEYLSNVGRTAKVGKPAPGFTLETVAGKKIDLSSFRGKKNVVLVFVYGDT